MSVRPVSNTGTSITEAQPTLEGAGVHLHRAFGFNEKNDLDPFLLFDDFRNDDPEAYAKGFPWHPHRGIETITYVLSGSVEHGDSLGNRGILGPGSVQWMTAGSGIMHQEMPSADARPGYEGQMHGFQLWANLPSSMKMTTPRYQDIDGEDMPTVVDDDGTAVKIICGEFWGKRGPVDGIAAEPRYLDISVPPNTIKTLKLETDRHCFAYVFAGNAQFRDASNPFGVLTEKEFEGEELQFRSQAGNRSLVKFDTGEEITLRSGDEGVRFLLISGKPIQEPVAWYGPIVMNTKGELRQAIAELNDGTFIRS